MLNRSGFIHSGLQSMLLNLALEQLDELQITTCEAVLTRLEEKAIAKWGPEKWKDALADEYTSVRRKCNISGVTKIKSRSHIEQIFKNKSKKCEANTLFQLAAAVGCEFRLFCGEKV
jgi:hypothetical protein